MYQFIEIIIKWKDQFLLLGFVLISLVLISTANTTKISGFKAFLIGSLGSTKYTIFGSGNNASIENENKALREMNLQLSQELISNRQAKFENERLRSIIGFKETFQKDIAPAEVIGVSEYNNRYYITINIGSLDSIKKGMPVRTDAGLVGVIHILSGDFAIVETLINRNVKVAVKDIRSGVYGMLEWAGAENFSLKNIPDSYDIKPGDLLVTSNYSNKYPEGIPVGIVRTVNNDLTSLFLDIKVDIAVDFKLLSQVFILKEIPDIERIILIENLENKIKNLN
ncbi:rod shape-determining protein MreC [Candidatus Kapabacteria bacterium]|nr:rod shape-determining protein MreC [Candidatus Kapabacteria bacterium]